MSALTFYVLFISRHQAKIRQMMVCIHCASIVLKTQEFSVHILLFLLGVTFFLWSTWILISVHSCLPQVKLLPLLQYSNIPLKWKQRQANYQHYFQTKSLLSVSSMNCNQRTRLPEMRWLREEAGTGILDSDKW